MRWSIISLLNFHLHIFFVKLSLQCSNLLPNLYLVVLLLNFEYPLCILDVCVCVCSVTPVVFDSLWPLWTIAGQAPMSMEFLGQEYCSESLFPSPEDLLHPGLEPVSPALKMDPLPTDTSYLSCMWLSNTLPFYTHM